MLYLAELCVVYFWANILFENIQKRYKNFGVKPVSYQTLSILVLDSSLEISMFNLIIYYGVTHTFPNLLAELLRFGDKHFYEVS